MPGPAQIRARPMNQKVTKISGCRDRSLLPSRRRLVDAEPPDDGRCPAGITYGGVAQEAGEQGSQFTSRDWASFLKHHNLEHSMSRCGNCHDNAVVESFFNLLKRERIRRRTYKTWVDARQDVFDYATTDADAGYLTYIFVNPAFRRRGYGSILLDTAQKAAGRKLQAASPISPLGEQFFDKVS